MEEKKRIDIFLSNKLNKSRNFIINNIKNGNILVNSKQVKPSYLIKKEDNITYNFKEEKIKPEEIKIHIIYEDDSIMVINKPSGMVVHPGVTNKSRTLVNGLLYYTPSLSDINGKERPGIVHRLDKDTSGLMIIAKTNQAHKILADDFANRKIIKKYIALVSGIIIENKGKIIAPIGRDTKNRTKMCVTSIGKEAITYFNVLERYKNTTLIECILETGRTHQIRVHMAYINHPIVNDPLYGKSFNSYGQMLHSTYLSFNHPITHKQLYFNIEPDKEFKSILDKFKNS